MQNLDSWLNGRDVNQPVRPIDLQPGEIIPGVLVQKQEVPWTAIAIIAVALLFMFKDKLPIGPSPKPTPAPVVPVDPVAPDVAIDQQLYRVLAGRDKSALQAASALYKAMGSIVTRLTPGQHSTGILAAWMADADMHRYWQTDYANKLPGLSAQVNKMFINQLGLEDRALTSDDLTNVSRLLNTIAATCDKAAEVTDGT